MRRSGDWPAADLLLIVSLALLLIPLATLTSGTPRTVLGVVFILSLPGYALVCALFPRRSSLGVVERLALSLGLSFAVAAIIGLGLNYSPWGIRLPSVLTSLVGFVLAMSAVAWYRRRGLAAEERFAPHLVSGVLKLAGGWMGQGRLSKTLTVAVVVAAVAAMGAATYVVARPNPGDKLTEFYVLDSGGRTENYPRQFMLGESGRVVVGIMNQEYQPTTYRLDITVDAEKVKTVGPVVLQHGEKREQAVDWTPTKAGNKQEVDFFLYRGPDIQPYRTLRLFVDVKGGP